MTQINRTALIELPAEKLYALVIDVGAYPTFLPWCSDASVSEQSNILQVASVTISKGPLKASFTTRNTLNAPSSATDETIDGDVRMQLLDGPFRQLDGYWRFKVLSATACKVTMDMNFEFARGPAGLLLTPVFAQICTTLLNAFVQQAMALHGDA